MSAADRVPDAVPELVGDDPVMNLLVLLGPAVVLAVAVLGRTAPGVALAAGYNLAFVGELVARAVRRDGEASHPEY